MAPPAGQAEETHTESKCVRAGSFPLRPSGAGKIYKSVQSVCDVKPPEHMQIFLNVTNLMHHKYVLHVIGYPVTEPQAYCI